ncbi:beta-ketoacyl-[acyl-carrier-protein] synthase family protein [Aquimarina sediminis]|uniref:beta-ketoacyl-[acyl-carrier-protein] synthase family protein n=1 Tax=Aquimarina sediminis TaxID=2070536 RepID=UPI000CA075E3|nr:beta-ketoacyl-[acyl-carrier-protein] synthase family protein [Aquimarina sediminis]
MSEQGVAITGMGIISSIGNTVEENLNALISSKKGIAPIVNIQTKHKDVIKVGEVLLTNEELAERLGLIKENNYSRTALLGCIAGKEALANAKIRNIKEYRTGLISATSVGGMDMTEKYCNTFGSDIESQKYITSHHAGDSTQKIAKQLGISEFVTTISTACSSATNAIMLGARLIKTGQLDRVVVGGTDCLSKFTINGFKTLMILSDTDCKPFDADRKGLNLGEAAAFIVLESNTVIQEQKKEVLAFIAGYGNANDAYHQTASSANGEGAYLAMQKALQVAGIKPEQVDYINVHGTATPNNDASEGAAIQRVFGESIPDFSSTKAFTGHTLAAAGAIEAVYSILALKHNVIFPNLNFDNPIPEFGMCPVTEVKEKALHYVLSNSFGFGGNCSTLIFSKN